MDGRLSAICAALSVLALGSSPAGSDWEPYPSTRTPLLLRASDSLDDLLERWDRPASLRTAESLAELLRRTPVGLLGNLQVPASEADEVVEALLCARGFELASTDGAIEIGRTGTLNDALSVSPEQLRALRDHPALVVKARVSAGGGDSERLAAELRGLQIVRDASSSTPATMELVGGGRQVAGAAWLLQAAVGGLVDIGDPGLPDPRGGIDLTARPSWSLAELLIEYARLTGSAIIADAAVSKQLAEQAADLARNRYRAEAVPTLVASALQPHGLVLVPLRTTRPAIFEVRPGDAPGWDGVDVEPGRVELVAEHAATRVRSVVTTQIGSARELVATRAGAPPGIRLAALGERTVVVCGTGADVVLWSRRHGRRMISPRPAAAAGD